MSFGYDGAAIYLHTAPTGKKIEYFAANPQVCFEFDRHVELRSNPESACKWTLGFESVIGYGTIRELLEPAEKEHGLNEVMRQYSGKTWSFESASMAKVRLWKIMIASLAGKRSRATSKAADQLRGIHGDMESSTDKTVRPLIRLARMDDLDAINAIYNHYILHSTCTYQETPESMEDRRKWFAHRGAPHPVTVAELNGSIVGWGSLSAYHARSAYRHTVENSIYVDQALQGRGIGSALLRDLIERARALGHHAIIAGIDGDQTASIALHAKFGFEQVGHLREVGFKFDRWLDVIYMELRLREGSPHPMSTR